VLFFITSRHKCFQLCIKKVGCGIDHSAWLPLWGLSASLNSGISEAVTTIKARLCISLRCSTPVGISGLKRGDSLKCSSKCLAVAPDCGPRKSQINLIFLSIALNYACETEVPCSANFLKSSIYARVCFLNIPGMSQPMSLIGKFENWNSFSQIHRHRSPPSSVKQFF